MQRRIFLKHSLTAGASFSVGACATRHWSASRTAKGAAFTDASNRRDLEAMAQQVLATDDIDKLALGWVSDGAGFRDLLGAAYLAGIQEVNPSPIGGQVHAMMMVPSASTVAGELRGKHKFAPAIFNLQRTKRSQGRDANGDDWQMPKAPAVEHRPPGELKAEFDKAMASWDEAGADQAITSLHATLSQDDFFELLWPWAARDFRIIGHKIIYATQTYRVLQDIGWRLGRDGVRSLVLGILDENPFGAFTDEQSKHILAVHQRNLARCSQFPVSWSLGQADPKMSLGLLEVLRKSDADAAAEEVVQALRRGVSATTVWDGIRLYAFELAMQNPNIAGMHPVTTVNALYRASLYTTRESTRRLMVLQAASWMPMFLPILAERRGRTTRRIDALQAGDRSDPFAHRDPVESSARAFRLAKNDDLGFRRQALEILARKAQHDHDYKFSVAAVEEIAATHPSLRPYLAGASMTMMRTEKNADNAAWRAVR